MPCQRDYHSGFIVSVGMASLIVQLSIVVIIAVNNNLLTKYGYETMASTENAYGAVISLFGSHNTEEYMEYARLCIRIFLGGIILTCYIKSVAIILQSMGNSMKSTILALLRDVIVFVPVSILIAMISKSIVTMLWATVISDLVAAIVGFIFVSTEIHKLEKILSTKMVTD